MRPFDNYFKSKYQKIYSKSSYRFTCTYDDNIKVYVHPEKLFDIIETNTICDADPIFKSLGSMVTNADVALDVGANIGVVSLWLAKRSNTVYSFEPDLNNIEFLKRNIELNDATNIHIVDKAVSNKSGKYCFYTREAFGHHGLQRKHVTKICKTDLLNTITLDEFCTLHNVSEVSVLKIDIEGSELNALEGFKNYLEQNKVKIIIFEHAPILLDSSLESRLAVFNYLTSFGYIIHNLAHDVMNLDDMAIAPQGDYYATLP
jgi:FkbM family methyltransferase